jgi:hypothetical protein
MFGGRTGCPTVVGHTGGRSGVRSGGVVSTTAAHGTWADTRSGAAAQGRSKAMTTSPPPVSAAEAVVRSRSSSGVTIRTPSAYPAARDASSRP